MYESAPADECCPDLKTPIDECPRDDVASWEKAQGANLWCVCCGRFWQGSPDEVAKAAEAWAEYEAEVAEDRSL